MATRNDPGSVRETGVRGTGGGLAGLPPAMAARHRGVDITVMDGSGIEGSGSMAGARLRSPRGAGGRGLR